jgi:hypothetical protein
VELDEKLAKMEARLMAEVLPTIGSMIEAAGWVEEEGMSRPRW